MDISVYYYKTIEYDNLLYKIIEKFVGFPETLPFYAKCKFEIRKLRILVGSTHEGRNSNEFQSQGNWLYIKGSYNSATIIIVPVLRDHGKPLYSWRNMAKSCVSERPRLR